MIKTAIVGMWVCAMTVAGGYLGATWQSGSHETSEKSLSKMTQVKVKPVSVPVISSGKVAGYVVAQFTFVAQAETFKKLSVKPDAFLLDAAYKQLYSGGEIDLTKLDKESWNGLAKSIKDQVNVRYGSEVLQEVLIEEFGYVPAGTARRGLDLASPAKGEKKSSPGH